MLVFTLLCGNTSHYFITEGLLYPWIHTQKYTRVGSEDDLIFTGADGRRWIDLRLRKRSLAGAPVLAVLAVLSVQATLWSDKTNCHRSGYMVF